MPDATDAFNDANCERDHNRVRQRMVAAVHFLHQATRTQRTVGVATLPICRMASASGSWLAGAMSLRNDAAGYGTVARLLHWLAALCILLAWGLGTFLDGLPKRFEPRALWLHETVGLALLAIVLVRLGWRLGGNPPPPSLPGPMARWSQPMAHGLHWLLYGLMIAVPVIGIVLTFARGQSLPLFSLAEIPSPWPRDRALARSLKGIHELGANLTILLATIHVAAALVHHYLLKDDTLRRMLPRPRK